MLYLDREIVEKSRELGFNLSKTFENHLKYLIIQFSTVNSVNNRETSVIVGSLGRDHRLGYNFYFLAGGHSPIPLFSVSGLGEKR